MLACQLGYLRKRAGTTTHCPLMNSLVFRVKVWPRQRLSAFMPKRLFPFLARPDSPQADSRAACAIVMLAGTPVALADATAAVVSRMMNSLGFNRLW